VVWRATGRRTEDVNTPKCVDGATLILLAAGELNSDDRRAAEEHLATCEECRNAFQELKRVGEVLAGVRGRTVAAGITPGRDCPEGEQLAAYADGSLDGHRAAAIEEHLASCRSCLAEVADLWKLVGPETHDATDATVAAVLDRLESDSRTAVVRLTERVLEVLQGFGACAADAVTALGAAAGEPALAASRAAGGPVKLEWEGSSGEKVEAELTRGGSGLQLTGRVTLDGRPTPAVSVSISGAAGTCGPETPDASGRFGPWPLAEGRNVMTFSGLTSDAGERTALTVVVE
jgi:anti-sigma factor RsiW